MQMLWRRMKMTIIDRVKQEKIIAIVRGIEQNRIIQTCEALYAGGISMIEITFDQSSPTGNKDTYHAIKKVADTLGKEVCVGAGTVMTIEQVSMAIEAGATYIISPNFDKAVVAKTLEGGAVSMPGVMTPSEIVDAYQAGAGAVKIFPIDRLGIGYLKAVKSPISHIPIIAVGGIDLDNAADYIKAGAIGLGIGSSLVDKQLIQAGKYDALTQRAKAFVHKVQM